MTPKIFSARLKELEIQGLINKKIDAKTFPIKSEYSLTKAGEEFMKVIKDVKQWTIKWKNYNPLCKNGDCKQCEI